MSEVPLKIVQKPGWQTDLNHPFITKVKEVIGSEKSTTIVLEYAKRDEKSDHNKILAERMAMFHSGRKTDNLGNNK